MSQTRSNYTPLLNALDNMKHSPTYAERRGILQGAIDAIISLQVRLREIEQVPEVAVPDDACKHGVKLPHECGECQDGVDSQTAVAWYAYESVASILEPHIERAENPGGFLPDNIQDSVQILLDHYLEAAPSRSQQSAGDWLPVSAVLPPEGEPFQAFHESWIDEDFNVYGIRECYRYGDGTQYASAEWFDYQDCWVVNSEVPQLWRPYVKPDRCPSQQSEQLKTTWYCGGCGQTDPSKRCLGCRA